MTNELQNIQQDLKQKMDQLNHQDSSLRTSQAELFNYQENMKNLE